MSEEPVQEPPSVAPPIASLLRKARSRRREPPRADDGLSPQAVRDGGSVSVDQEQLVAPPPAAPANSVGVLLRQAREQRGQDLESVARALRIRHPYLVAIEEGRYKDLPGAPYASGFVRSYAEFLGLDAPEILRRFREESGGLGGRTELVFPAPVSEGGFPAAVLILVVLILAALVYGAWYFYQWRHSGNAESVSELPDRLTALIHPPGGEDQPSAGDAQASPAATEPSTPLRASTEKATATPVQTSVQTPAPAPAQTPAPAPAPADAASTPAPPPSQAMGTGASPSPAPATAQPATAAPPTPAPAPVASSTTAAPTTPTTVSSATPTPAPQPVQPQAQAPAQATADANKTESVADATPPPTVSSSGPGQSAPPAPDLGQPSRVVLRATDDCWIEIRDPTGAIVSSRLLHKGDTYPVPPRPGLTLTVGNAGALTLLLDGAVLPPLGKSGMVRHDILLDPDRVGSPASTTATVPAND